MPKQTPLYNAHIKLNAQMVDFGGWDMPLNYGSQLAEHHAVRQNAGMFDVSHMGIVDIKGAEAYDLLRYALANDVARLQANGQAIYSCLLNEDGGIIDDLICYKMAHDFYRIVWNAATQVNDFNWLTTLNAKYGAQLIRREDLAMIAVQGPNVRSLVATIYAAHSEAILNLKPFNALIDGEMQIARTGYTGEDGVEIIAPVDDIVELWQTLLAHDVQACGLGARDTLRLEAGLNLYGHDMTAATSPYASNLGWTVSFKDDTREFVGKQALQAQAPQQKLVGVVMTDKGVLRDAQAVLFDALDAGVITSGGFSPTLKHAIAMARVPAAAGSVAYIERRGKKIQVALIDLPFVRQGKKVFKQKEPI